MMFKCPSKFYYGLCYAICLISAKLAFLLPCYYMNGIDNVGGTKKNLIAK